MHKDSWKYFKIFPIWFELHFSVNVLSLFERSRNSNPSPISTTNPTKKPSFAQSRSPHFLPPSSSNSSPIILAINWKNTRFDLRFPLIPVEGGIPTPPTLVSSLFGGMEGSPLSLHWKLASWSNVDAYRAHNVALLANGANLSLSLSLFDPGNGIPLRGGRSKRIRWRERKGWWWLSFQEGYLIRPTRNIDHCSTRYSGVICVPRMDFSTLILKAKKQYRFQPVTKVKDTECLCYTCVINRWTRIVNNCALFIRILCEIFF